VYTVLIIFSAFKILYWRISRCISFQNVLDFLSAHARSAAPSSERSVFVVTLPGAEVRSERVLILARAVWLSLSLAIGFFGEKHV